MRALTQMNAERMAASGREPDPDADPPLREHILVLIGDSATAPALLQAARRLAQALDAHWIAVDLRLSAPSLLRRQADGHRQELLQAAQFLGAETVTLHGTSAGRTLADYARLRHVSKILIDAARRPGWSMLRHAALLASLRRANPHVDVLSIAAPSAPAPTRRKPVTVSERGASRLHIRHFLLSVAITLACTVVAYPLAGHVDLINIVMIYLLGAALAGLLLGRWPAAMTATLNTLAFDFFFVPPLFSLAVLDPSYIVTFAVMLIVALVIANLMIAIRQQTEAASAREHQTAILYAITRDLAIARDTESMISTAERHIGEMLQCHALVLLCDDDERVLMPERGADAHPAIDPTTAGWVAAKRERAGSGTPQFPSDPARYLPLRGSHTTIGVLVIEAAGTAKALSPEQQGLLEVIADQLALALERARMSQVAYEAKLAAERAAMRNTLLASISHDLRTPLSAIAGAGSMMAQSDFVLDLYRRVMLGRLIEDKARDMTELLSNVLELVRLESGGDVLARDWSALHEIVTIALQRHEDRLTGWQVSTDVASDLPLLCVDANLLVQVLSNLLENAVKYTPPGTRIAISAHRVDESVRLTVQDSGPGFGNVVPDQLFDKFARGRIEGNSGGVGLGLAICRVIVRLHGGEVRASNNSGGGARFDITLPISHPVSALRGVSTAE